MDLYQPVRTPAFVCQEACKRHFSNEVAEQVHDRPTAVRPRAQNRIGKDRARRLGPSQDRPSFRDVVHLGQVGSTGPGICIPQTELAHPLFIAILVLIHTLQQLYLLAAQPPVFVVQRRSGIQGKGELGLETRRDQFVKHLQRWGDAGDGVGNDKVPVPFNSCQPCCPKCLAVENHGFHCSLQDGSLSAPQDISLFLREFYP